jgi:NADPH-dependent 2,4-dienoyl-CoA reductase/sulfur reductase-like enzyme
MMKSALLSSLVLTQVVTAFAFSSSKFTSRASFPTSLNAKKYVVVGGGWGGWGAAKALCEGSEDVDVTLIDALPDPTGVSFDAFFVL